MTEKTTWLATRMQSGLARGLTNAWRNVQVQPGAYLVQLQHAHGLPIQSFQDVYALPQQTIDELADETIASARKIAAIEGTGLGFFGFLSLVPDMAILATISVQMMQKLSLLYGFEISTDAERAELWLAAASAFGVDMGKEFLEKEVLERLVPRIIMRLSGRMGVEFAEKAAGKIVPVLSAGVSGALNYYFVKQWGERVKNHFREKHLAVRQTLLLSEIASSTITT